MIDPKKSLWGALKNIDVQGLVDGAAQMAEGATQSDFLGSIIQSLLNQPDDFLILPDCLRCIRNRRDQILCT